MHACAEHHGAGVGGETQDPCPTVRTTQLRVGAAPRPLTHAPTHTETEAAGLDDFSVGQLLKNKATPWTNGGLNTLMPK